MTYEKLLQTTPRNVPALINYARWLMASDPKKALPLAKSAFELKPEYPDAAYVLGQLAFKTADYPWARRLLELAAQAQPQAPEVQFDYGNALYAVGQVPAARAAIGTALQTGRLSRADEARRFLQLTALADNLEDVAAVQTQLPQLQKSAPDYIPALMLKALLAQQQTNWMEVEQTDLAILKHYPDFAPAQGQLAWVLRTGPGQRREGVSARREGASGFSQGPKLDPVAGHSRVPARELCGGCESVAGVRVSAAQRRGTVLLFWIVTIPAQAECRVSGQFEAGAPFEPVGP